MLAWPRFSAPRRGAVNCVTLRPAPMRSWGPCPPLPDRGRLWSREGAEVRLDRLAAGASEPGPRFYALYALSFLQCWGGHVDQPRPAGWTGGRTGPRGPTAPQGRAAVRLRHAGGPGPDRKDRPRGRPRGPPAVFRACVAGWLVTGGDTAASFQFGRRDPGIPIPAPRWPALRVSDQSRNFPCLCVLLDDVRMTVTVPMPAVIAAPTSQAPARVW